MEFILIHQDCANVLMIEINMLACMSQKGKNDMINKVRNPITLCLGDKVLREVTKEKTTALM